MSLQVDLRKLQECLEDSLSRLECLRECHLLEHPQLPLPDFLFPLQKTLQDSLLEVHLQQQVRPQVRQAIQELLEDPQTQVLMEKLAQVEAQEQAQVESKGWNWILGKEM